MQDLFNRRGRGAAAPAQQTETVVEAQEQQPLTEDQQQAFATLMSDPDNLKRLVAVQSAYRDRLASTTPEQRTQAIEAVRTARDLASKGFDALEGGLHQAADAAGIDADDKTIHNVALGISGVIGAYVVYETAGLIEDLMIAGLVVLALYGAYLHIPQVRETFDSIASSARTGMAMSYGAVPADAIS